MKRFLRKLFTVILLVFLLLAGWIMKEGLIAERFPGLASWKEPRLIDIEVYGEHAHFALKPGFGRDVQLVSQDTVQTASPAAVINQGLYLPALEPGQYRLYAADLRLQVGEDYLLEGYTITRNGRNKHYRFEADEGRLLLTIGEVERLPEDVYDIMIDAGHGGNNIGATPSEEWQEKTENLRSSLYMAELFSDLGLKVALTRNGDYVPGQPGVASADVDPYVPDGRVDLAYQGKAKYFLSNHLNASPRGAFRGYQLYTSVRTDTGWAKSIAPYLDAAGHMPNDDFLTFGRLGIYKRYTQDDAETGSDYYYIIRETGGLPTGARRMIEAYPERDFRQGAEAILLEYLFLDNRHDREFWEENWQSLVEAVVKGCADYWNL